MSDSGCCGGGEIKVPTPSMKDKILASVPPVMVAPYGSGLKCLEFTLFPGTPAVIHDDGSIEYEPSEGPAPPDISGYIRDAGNPFLFRPQWPTCEQRYHGTKQVGQGFIDVVMVCGCRDVPQYNRPVHVNECLACPMNQQANVSKGNPR